MRYIQILSLLLLRRFKKWRFITSFTPNILLILYTIVKYLLKGTWDEAFFSWLLQFFTGGRESAVPIENIVLIGIPSLGIVGILAWMYVDARREFRSEFLPDNLTKMHERMLHFVTLRI